MVSVPICTHLELLECFGDPLTNQVLTTWPEGRQNGLVIHLRLCDVRALKASNLLKLLQEFKSILYLIPSTKHTHTHTRPKLVLFYLQPLEIVDQDREPSEKFGSQIEEQV